MRESMTKDFKDKRSQINQQAFSLCSSPDSLFATTYLSDRTQIQLTTMMKANKLLTGAHIRVLDTKNTSFGGGERRRFPSAWHGGRP